MQLKLSLFTAAALALLATAKPFQHQPIKPRCDTETETHPAHPTSPTSRLQPQPTPTWTPKPHRPTVTTTEFEPEPTVTVSSVRTTTITATVTTGRSGGHPHHPTTSGERTQPAASTPTPPPAPAPTSPATPTSSAGSGGPTGSPSGNGDGGNSGGECNTGPIQCCDQVQDVKSEHMSGILSSLGLDALGLSGLAGTSCSPIDVLALGGGESCNQMPVCCNDNTFQGLINIGCVPIIVQL